MPGAGQPRPRALQRLVDDLVHVEIAVGSAASDELHLRLGPRQVLVAAIERLRGAVAGLHRIVALHVVVGVRARLLEPFAMVWINQSLLRGKGRMWALAAIDMPAA